MNFFVSFIAFGAPESKENRYTEQGRIQLLYAILKLAVRSLPYDHCPTRIDKAFRLDDINRQTDGLNNGLTD